MNSKVSLFIIIFLFIGLSPISAQIEQISIIVEKSSYWHEMSRFTATESQHSIDFVSSNTTDIYIMEDEEYEQYLKLIAGEIDTLSVRQNDVFFKSAQEVDQTTVSFSLDFDMDLHIIIDNTDKIGVNGTTDIDVDITITKATESTWNASGFFMFQNILGLLVLGYALKR